MSLESPNPWQEAGNCRRRGVNPDWFFALRRTEEYAAAKACCSDCPIRDRCLELSRGVKYGIWGGLDEHERGER